jgi:hypothetical protein
MESEILKKLESIEKRLDKIEKETFKMSSHVDFVESVYRLVRRPFSYFLRGAELPPLIENKITELE